MHRSKSTFHLPSAVAGIVSVLIVLWLLVSGAIRTIPPWQLGAGAVVLVGTFISVLLLLEKRRTGALRAVAQELGLEFSKRSSEAALRPFFQDLNPADGPKLGDFGIELGSQPAAVVEALEKALAKAASSRAIHHSALRQLSLFQRVEHSSGRNVMRGRLGGGDALVFEYSYHTPVGDATSTSATQTVAAFRFPGKKFAAFEVSTQGILQTLASRFGAQDFNFDAHPDFSKRFRLRGDDESAVRALFDPGLLQSFERLDGSFDQIVEGAGDCVVVYRLGKRVGPAKMKAFIQQATTVVGAVAGAVGRAGAGG